MKKHERFTVIIYILLGYGFATGTFIVAGMPIILAGILMAVGGFIAGFYSSKMLEWCMRGG